MKKIALVALAALMVLSLVGCTRNCKEKGCDRPVYEDGYCELHLLEKELGDLFG